MTLNPCPYQRKNGGKYGRGERIRTAGPCLPNTFPLRQRHHFLALQEGVLPIWRGLCRLRSRQKVRAELTAPVHLDLARG